MIDTIVEVTGEMVKGSKGWILHQDEIRRVLGSAVNTKIANNLQIQPAKHKVPFTPEQYEKIKKHYKELTDE